MYISEIISNFGILASGALILFMGRHRLRLSFASPFHGVFVGILFGILSVIVVNVPVSMPTGAVFDTRAGPAILSGFFGGPVGGLISAIIGGYARYTIGGRAVTGGVLSFFMYALAGVVGGYVLRRFNLRPTLLFFICLTLFSTVFALPVVFVDEGLEFGLNILKNAWYVLLIGNVSGVVILGLISEEIRGYSQQYESTRRDLITSDLARASANIAVWRHDVRTDCLEWDDAMYQLYNVDKRENPMLSSWSDCLHPQDKDETIANYRQAMENNTTYEHRYRILTGDGSDRWIQAHGQFLTDDKGVVTESIGLNWEVTPEVINKIALEHARDEAVLMNEKLERFAYMASHDLQEPLRKINLYVSYLEDALKRDDREDVKYAYEVIWKSGRRARELVKDLLEFSRAQNYEMAFEKLMIRGIVNDVLVEQSEVIAENWAAIEVTGPKTEIVADRKHIHMLFSNLIGNALKYHSQERKPEIMISITHTPDTILVEVRDNGVGFELKDTNVIFEPFRRLHGPAEYSGSGIGLSICKAVCDAHGWEISAKSVLGAGSVFSISIPSRMTSEGQIASEKAA